MICQPRSAMRRWGLELDGTVSLLPRARSDSRQGISFNYGVTQQYPEKNPRKAKDFRQQIISEEGGPRLPKGQCLLARSAESIDINQCLSRNRMLSCVLQLLGHTMERKNIGLSYSDVIIADESKTGALAPATRKT